VGEPDQHALAVGEDGNLGRGAADERVADAAVVVGVIDDRLELRQTPRRQEPGDLLGDPQLTRHG
jgi:hypothetical protein